MKKFTNVTTDLTKTTGLPKTANTPERKEVKMKYSDFCKACLNQAPAGGWDMETMKKRNRIEDIIEKSGKTIELEDHDHATLLPLVKAMKWGMKHKDIVSFGEAVENAK